MKLVHLKRYFVEKHIVERLGKKSGAGLSFPWWLLIQVIWATLVVSAGAHMFWWLYRSTSKASNTTIIPVIMWLQGGPVRHHLHHSLLFTRGMKISF